MPETTISATVARIWVCDMTARSPATTASSGGSVSITRPPGSRTREATAPATSVATPCIPIAHAAPTRLTVAPASAGPMMKAVSNDDRVGGVGLVPEPPRNRHRHERAEAHGRDRERRPETGQEQQQDGGGRMQQLPAAHDAEEQRRPHELGRDDAAHAGMGAVEPRTHEGPGEDPGQELRRRPGAGDGRAVGGIEQVDDHADLAHRVGQARKRDGRDQGRIAGDAQKRSIAL